MAAGGCAAAIASGVDEVRQALRFWDVLQEGFALDIDGSGEAMAMAAMIVKP